MKKTSSTILALVLGLTLTLQAKTIHVKTDGSDTADGASWATAYKTVTKALAGAASGD